MVIDAGWKRIIERCVAAGIKPSSRGLLVSIGSQTLRFYSAGSLQKAYIVSTSRRPPSNINGSLGTPRGLHAIAEKIGAGQPPGIVFKHRVATGFHFSEHAAHPDVPAAPPGGNLITTRILWLKGIEPGVNQGGDVDTHDRYIYIHGTNREDLLGQPQSAGCVLMGNLDVIELFEQVRVGDPVWIEGPADPLDRGLPRQSIAQQ
jgi:lipoprotein-anchoring transpeptidase ErfK/SrfK